MKKVNISIITSLYKPSIYLDSFLNYVSQINNLEECELILIHNDPLAEDIETIYKFCLKKIISVKHIAVSRETLYASWNRAIKLADGHFMAIWNVDDIRNSSSLLSQKKALENENAVMCYGDYYATDTYGFFKKKIYQYDDNYVNLKKRANNAHVIGCFPMWKKEIHEQIGYFDEQFKLVGDWEFQMRVVRNFSLVKAEEILGFCLVDKPHRLSSNRHLQYKEQTVVWLRFKLYDKILLHYVPLIKNFRINQFFSFDSWHNISNTIPNRRFGPLKDFNLIFRMPFAYTIWGIERILARVRNYFGLNRLKIN